MGDSLRRALLVAVLWAGPGACSRMGDVLTPEATGGISGSGGELGGNGPSDGGSGGGGLGGANGRELPPVQQIAAGNHHTCLIAGGGLYCFGEGGQGALGVGDVTSRAAPTLVDADNDYVTVRAGGDFTCALRGRGEVVCFGAGDSGQLGDGGFMGSTTPVSVQLPGDAVALSAGHNHACAVVGEVVGAEDQAPSGDLYCWGANAEGQLGQGDPFPDPGVSRAVPVQVAAGEKWSSVSCGQGHTCAIREDGSVWCWGRNSSGELGLGPGVSAQIRLPQRVGSEADWVSVASGQHHTCGLRGAEVAVLGGTLWCWGANASGQLGSSDDSVRPEPVSGPSGVLQVATDTFHTCILREGGRLACAGRNAEGQLGVGDVEPRWEFVDVASAASWSGVSAGRFHTCAIDGDGSAACAGANAAGQLGQGDAERRRTFSSLAEPVH